MLHPSQSGFYPGFSTKTTLLEVADTIKLAVDRGSQVALILLELSTAFDTVSHPLLLQHLCDNGVNGPALTWLHSFLTDRHQSVRMAPFTSEPNPLDFGVSQGSALSPTLFNVYMAPLATLVESFGVQIVSYTDDTQLLLTR